MPISWKFAQLQSAVVNLSISSLVCVALNVTRNLACEEVWIKISIEKRNNIIQPNHYGMERIYDSFSGDWWYLLFFVEDFNLFSLTFLEINFTLCWRLLFYYGYQSDATYGHDLHYFQLFALLLVYAFYR